MFYTYAHLTSDTNRIFYIGKGSGSRAFEKGKDRNPHWTAVVNKHKGYYATILAYWETETEAYEHEKLLIACLNELNHNLTNKTPGGEGIPKGYKFSEETVRKMTLAKIGSKRTEETKQKMSKSSAWRGHTYITPGFTGFNHTEESRTKMSLARKGRKQSPEHIAKRTASRLLSPNPNIGRKHTKFTCPHCNKEGAKAGLTRWHYDNCKWKV